jgi:hypothetical protein
MAQTRGNGRIEINLTRAIKPSREWIESIRRYLRPHLYRVKRLSGDIKLKLRCIAVQASLPGSSDQPTHINGGIHSETYYTLLCSITPPSAEAGGTFFPGPGGGSLVLPEVGKGVLFRGDIDHFGTGNRSPDTRYFFYMSFSRYMDPNCES